MEPAPEFLLRLHASDVNSLSFSPDASQLCSADGQGIVAIWSMQTFRPVLCWKAHSESILAVVHLGTSILTHGRDNTIHQFSLLDNVEHLSDQVASLSRQTPLTPVHTLQVSTVTFCKLAYLQLDSHTLARDELLIAVPAVLHDNLVDLFHLPSERRISRSIGANVWASTDKTGNTGTVMALALLDANKTHGKSVRLVVAYEDGRLAMFESSSQLDWSVPRSEEGQGWDIVWFDKGHREPVMGMTLSPDLQFAWTVAADHLVVRWALEAKDGEAQTQKLVTPDPGRSSIALRSDGKILAIGGWDGNVRVHSAKTFKPLAVLSCHRDSVHAVAFAPLVPQGRAWLAAAGKDARISLWELYPPSS